ncbi:MAG: ATP-binding cassette domain-containing protein [Anaerolineae bacterium]
MTEPVIHLSDVSFDYPPLVVDGAPIPVFAGLSLAVEAGDFVGVVGPNGAGKTTLLLILAGLAPRLTHGRLRGEVHVRGRAGMVFQEIEGQLFNPTVEAEIAWGLENLGLPLAEIERRLEWALAAMGLKACRFAPPGELSGGQQKRVALAATLAMQPDILLLDEPTAGLDPVGRQDVLAALADLRRVYPVTVVMAENDAETVARFARRVVVLHAGRAVRDATPQAVFREISFLDEIGAPVPPAARLAAMLRGAGHPADFLTLEQAREALARWQRGDGTTRAGGSA